MNEHYLKRYNKIVSFFKEVQREGFNERHHIIPKCMGGSDASDNIVILPARAHFICHYLLHKAYPENKKLAHAFAMMNVKNKYRDQTPSKLYERARIARSLALTGVPRPEWVKEKLRKPKANKENYRGKKSETHKRNIGNALRGRKHDWQFKVVESEGYKGYMESLKEITNKKRLFHRENFQRLNVSRKEYYKMYAELSSSTLKKYLSGL
jgi:hypothetical protein